MLSEALKKAGRRSIRKRVNNGDIDPTEDYEDLVRARVPASMHALERASVRALARTRARERANARGH